MEHRPGSGPAKRLERACRIREETGAPTRGSSPGASRCRCQPPPRNPVGVARRTIRPADVRAFAVPHAGDRPRSPGIRRRRGTEPRSPRCRQTVPWAVPSFPRAARARPARQRDRAITWFSGVGLNIQPRIQALEAFDHHASVLAPESSAQRGARPPPARPGSGAVGDALGPGHGDLRLHRLGRRDDFEDGRQRHTADVIPASRPETRPATRRAAALASGQKIPAMAWTFARFKERLEFLQIAR